jgi:hypothetical protein
MTVLFRDATIGAAVEWCDEAPATDAPVEHHNGCSTIRFNSVYSRRPVWPGRGGPV